MLNLTLHLDPHNMGEIIHYHVVDPSILSIKTKCIFPFKSDIIIWHEMHIIKRNKATSIHKICACYIDNLKVSTIYTLTILKQWDQQNIS